MIWKRHLTLDELNATSDNTMVAHLGIVYTRLGDDVLEAEMPVDTRTHQPFGLLHGGASAALAETLGSMAGFMMTRDGQCVVGTELNATHHRPVSEGKVRGVCQPLHLAALTPPPVLAAPGSAAARWTSIRSLVIPLRCA